MLPSASTTSKLLNPTCSWYFLRCFPARAATFEPVCSEPVKLTPTILPALRIVYVSS
jgi:hypothetical protein